MLAAEALNIMEQRKITSLVVVDGEPRESPASCTCTICGGRRCSEMLTRSLNTDRGKRADGMQSCSCSTSTAC